MARFAGLTPHKGLPRLLREINAPLAEVKPAAPEAQPVHYTIESYGQLHALAGRTGSALGFILFRQPNGAAIGAP
jgi:hypothetical protein